jgi:hypothetical protein
MPAELWSKFSKPYGMDLAAALAPGPTSRAHPVTEHDQKGMLNVFVEQLGQQFHTNMLGPLLVSLWLCLYTIVQLYWLVEAVERAVGKAATL